jgi:hypothetical protein
MDEAIEAFLARLLEQSAEIRPCYGLPTDAADACRDLVARDDHHEPDHPRHVPDESDGPPPPPPGMPPGRAILSNDVVRRRYTEQEAQQMAAVRASQIVGPSILVRRS